MLTLAIILGICVVVGGLFYYNLLKQVKEELKDNLRNGKKIYYRENNKKEWRLIAW